MGAMPASLIDISPLISEQIAVWPGDVPYRRDITLQIAAGSNIDLSAIHGTVHLGAHTDAPSHYAHPGESIEQRSLDRYYGPCQVIAVSRPRGARIYPHHLAGTPITAPRVLLYTGSYPDPATFNPDFNSLSPELVAWLHDMHGVTLVGIDTPSVDPADSTLLESHQAIAARDMAILEGVILAHVAPGSYLLIALPLKLAGADASPVRAALLPLDAG